jgi:putative glycosyltransferase (TIGR04372 family)
MIWGWAGYPVRILWRVSSRILTVLLLPLSGAVWTAKLLVISRRIRRADEVVLMTAPNSFAHTVMGPDGARRFFSGKKVLFLIAAWRHEYNPVVEKIWPDIDVVFVQRFLLTVSYKHKVISLPFHAWHDRMVQWITRRCVTMIDGKGASFYDLHTFYRRMIEEYGARSPGVLKAGLSTEITVAWFSLIDKVPAPKVGLPAPIREKIISRLENLWPSEGVGKAQKLCCIYLRQERRETHHARLRNGSPLESHLPAVRRLSEAGYQVLLTGDQDMGADTRKEFDGKFVDHHLLGVARNIFQIFAATEADIFIGSNGGGEVFAAANKIPCLFINWFPFSAGRPNAWVYFKSAADHGGKPISGEQLISDYAYDFSASFGQLIENTEEEITEAVEHFISNLGKDVDQECADIAAEIIPEDSMFHLFKTKISPCWIKKHLTKHEESPVDLEVG